MDREEPDLRGPLFYSTSNFSNKSEHPNENQNSKFQYRFLKLQKSNPSDLQDIPRLLKYQIDKISLKQITILKDQNSGHICCDGIVETKVVEQQSRSRVATLRSVQELKTMIPRMLWLTKAQSEVIVDCVQKLKDAEPSFEKATLLLASMVLTNSINTSAMVTESQKYVQDKLQVPFSKLPETLRAKYEEYISNGGLVVDAVFSDIKPKSKLFRKKTFGRQD